MTSSSIPSVPAHPPLAILGAGGHARVVFDIAIALGRQVLGFIDTGTPIGTPVSSSCIIGDESVLDDPALAVAELVIGIGNAGVRRRLGRQLAERGRAFTTLVHPAAVLGSRVNIGAGSVVFAGAVINCDSTIGKHAIINTGARIDHDTVLGDGVHVCPGAVLAGTVTVGDWSMIGAGSVVINNIAIGADTVIGAGSVVVRDVPSGVTAFGNPCAVRPVSR